VSFCWKPPLSPAQTGMPYIIKSGDTLFGIARASGCTVKALKSINSLASERLMVGQKLKIPESRVQVASVTRSL
jgi:LysM repeat protein